MALYGFDSLYGLRLARSPVSAAYGGVCGVAPTVLSLLRRRALRCRFAVSRALRAESVSGITSLVSAPTDPVGLSHRIRMRQIPASHASFGEADTKAVVVECSPGNCENLRHPSASFTSGTE